MISEAKMTGLQAIRQISPLSDSEALTRAVLCLLENIAKDHCWQDFQADWSPVITCITAELLMDLGLPSDRPWYIKRGGYILCTPQQSFHWLDGCIQSDGSFGTDFWDAARLGVLIERYVLHSHFQSYSRLHEHLLDITCGDVVNADDSVWRGPGFVAVAAQYLRLVGRWEEANRAIASLIAMQAKRGFWQGPVGRDGYPLVSPIWHTAQAVQLLAGETASESRDSVARAVQWLKDMQGSNGAWPAIQQYLVYFTAYAVLALVAAGENESDAVRQAIDYLKKRISPDGRCSDLGGTLMCTLALKAVVGPRYERGLPPADYVLARSGILHLQSLEDELGRVADERDDLKHRLSVLEERYKDADIVLTKKHLLVIVLVSLLLTAAGTAAGLFAIISVAKP